MPDDPLGPTPLSAYRAAIEAGDVDGVAACFALDATLKSPITDRFAFQGREQVRALMEDVFAVIDDRHTVEDIGDDRVRVLKGTGTVSGIPISEVLLVTLDGDGLISRMELYVRPLPGLTALAAALGPRIAARHSRSRGRLVKGMIAPLAFMTRHGEGVGSRLARP